MTFVYNITKNGTEVRSEEAVRTLGLLSDQEMALTLGYVVAEKASSKSIFLLNFFIFIFIFFLI